MSSRYGRNQKRQARAEIEQLRAAVATAQALTRRVSERALRLGNALRDIAEMLPQGSALLAPEHMRTDLLMHDRLWVAPINRAPMLRFDDADASSPAVATAVLVAVEATLRDDPHFGGVHAIVSYGDSRVAYALDEKALRTMPRHRLFYLVKHEIASTLTEALLRKAGR